MAVLCLFVLLWPVQGIAAQVTIYADRPGPEISPTMWGIFFEDINFGADGGPYAELVKNRSFEFPDSLMGWKAKGPGSAEVRHEDPYSLRTPARSLVTPPDPSHFQFCD